MGIRDYLSEKLASFEGDPSPEAIAKAELCREIIAWLDRQPEMVYSDLEDGPRPDSGV